MKNYHNLFRLAPTEPERLLAIAGSQGAGFADLYFEYTVASMLVLQDGKVSSSALNEDYGTGIRAVSVEKTGYSYCESTLPEDMEKAAMAAAAIGAGAGRIGRSRCQASPTALYGMETDWNCCGIAAQIGFLKSLEEKIHRADARVKKVIARVDWSVSDLLMFNSLGESAAETRPMGNVRVSVILDGFSNSVSRSYRMGAEMLDEGLASSLAALAVKGIDDKLSARRPKGGVMPVVIGAGAGGILLHEAMGHAFEADFNRKNQSVFSGRIGERVCRPGINIVDDGLLPSSRGSMLYDDEAVPGQKTYMVSDGVLTSYLHDRLSAGAYGVAPTGNGRRESFRYEPIPRMRSTYMESGGYAPEEIVSSVKKGIYVDEFANGQVKIGEGDFTFYVKSGYLIEDGRLTAPVKDINIIGNGPEALADISMVGNDLKIDDGAWTCGKDQSVPVSCGIPTVLVDRLTVGGE